jgi:hypothetical protein
MFVVLHKVGGVYCGKSLHYQYPQEAPQRGSEEEGVQEPPKQLDSTVLNSLRVQGVGCVKL